MQLGDGIVDDRGEPRTATQREAGAQSPPQLADVTEGIETGRPLRSHPRLITFTYGRSMNTTATNVTVEQLVSDALDQLPEWILDVLAAVPVLVLDGGREARAYGLYRGDGVAGQRARDQIVIFRDTLLRDFGHDPALLAAQVEQTVRHEVAHHLGHTESAVAALGL